MNLILIILQQDATAEIALFLPYFLKCNSYYNYYSIIPTYMLFIFVGYPFKKKTPSKVTVLVMNALRTFSPIFGVFS